MRLFASFSLSSGAVGIVAGEIVRKSNAVFSVIHVKAMPLVTKNCSRFEDGRFTFFRINRVHF